MLKTRVITAIIVAPLALAALLLLDPPHFGRSLLSGVCAWNASFAYLHSPGV